MKKLLLATSVVVCFASSAFAADLPARTYTKAPAYVPEAVYNWTGFYIGGHIGGAFNGDSTLGSSSRFMAGVQGGADYQFAQNWVVGIEGQYSFVDRTGGSAAFPGGFTISDRNTNLGSVTGRLGYAWGPALLYAKGGYAFRENPNDFVTATATGAPVAFTSSSRTGGYTVGAGLEYMFAPHWSAKLEYQYYNFGRNSVTVPVAPGGGVGLVSFRDDVHTIKAGINYRFNWGG